MSERRVPREVAIGANKANEQATSLRCIYPPCLLSLFLGIFPSHNGFMRDLDVRTHLDAVLPLTRKVDYDHKERATHSGVSLPEHEVPPL